LICSVGWGNLPAKHPIFGQISAMTFKEYLQSKKIDEKGFALEQPERFQELELLFGQVHPDSFTAQKLFLINRIRRSHPLAISEQMIGEVQVAKMMKPKFNIPPKKD